MSGHWSNRIFRTHLPISNVCFRLQAAWRDDRCIHCQGCRCLDGLQTGIEDVREAHVVLMEEPLQGALSRPLDLRKCRPTRNEVAEQQRIKVFEPLKHLRVILFQRIAQSIGDTDPVIFNSGRNSLQLPTSVRYCLLATRVEQGATRRCVLVSHRL